MVGSSPNLEVEIAQIEQQLAQKREALQAQHQAGEIKEIPHPKETLHQVVGEQINEAITSVPTDDSTTPPSDDLQQASPLPPASQASDDFSVLPPAAQQTVQNLVNIAFLKSIDEAIKMARATNNSSIIDGFHDLLVDQLYTQLIERGKIKQL